MLDNFELGIGTHLKSDHTVVTAADRAVNSLVIKSVKLSYPSHAVIGEEESYDNSSAQYIWVCDPIDGTIPYSLNIPTNVFSLALVRKIDGLPILAVVYDPYLKRLYSAMKDHGAFMNHLPIQVNKHSEMHEAIIGISSGKSRVTKVAEQQAAIIKNIYRPLSLNSTIYEAMLVASGRIVATVFSGQGAHDAVTAKLIVEEAGGKVTDLFGNEQRYDQRLRGALITNSFVYDELSQIISPFLIN